MVDISNVGGKSQPPEWPQDKNFNLENHQGNASETLNFVERLTEHLAVLAKDTKDSLEK